MAGSYRHIKDGWSLIENMGDAHEAVEELLWLVESEIGEKKAKWLLHEYFYPMKRGDRIPDHDLMLVQQVMSE